MRTRRRLESSCWLVLDRSSVTGSIAGHFAVDVLGELLEECRRLTSGLPDGLADARIEDLGLRCFEFLSDCQVHTLRDFVWIGEVRVAGRSYELAAVTCCSPTLKQSAGGVA